MKLWLLRPVKGLKESQDPWSPWYDKAFGFVIRAQTEGQARLIANAEGGDETGPAKHYVYRTGGDAWLDAALSTCEELTPTGKTGVVIRDFASA